MTEKNGARGNVFSSEIAWPIKAKFYVKLQQERVTNIYIYIYI